MKQIKQRVVDLFTTLTQVEQLALLEGKAPGVATPSVPQKEGPEKKGGKKSVAKKKDDQAEAKKSGVEEDKQGKGKGKKAVKGKSKSKDVGKDIKGKGKATLSASSSSSSSSSSIAIIRDQAGASSTASSSNAFSPVPSTAKEVGSTTAAWPSVSWSAATEVKGKRTARLAACEGCAGDAAEEDSTSGSNPGQMESGSDQDTEASLSIRPRSLAPSGICLMLPARAHSRRPTRPPRPSRTPPPAPRRKRKRARRQRRRLLPPKPDRYVSLGDPLVPTRPLTPMC